MINNIILISLIVLLFVATFIFLRQFYLLKMAFEEILLKTMKDHESVILAEKQLLKDFKISINNINRIEKDINNTRINIKTLLDELEKIYNKKVKI